MILLGSIVCAPATSKNNATTAVPFVIPTGTPALFIITTAADVTIRIDADAGVPATLAAVAGDFASQNQYYTYDAGPGGLVAGVGGVNIGLFAWTYPPVAGNAASESAVTHVRIRPQGTMAKQSSFSVSLPYLLK